MRREAEDSRNSRMKLTSRNLHSVNQPIPEESRSDISENIRHVTFDLYTANYID